MKVLLAALVLIVAALVQVTALPYLTGTSVNIYLVLLLVVAWGIIKGAQEGLLWGLIGGLVLDVLSAAPFGSAMAVLGAIGLVSGWRAVPLLRGSVLSPLVAAGLATIVYDGFQMALIALLGREWRWLDTFSSVVLPAALLNAVIMAPIYWVLHRINRQTKPLIKW